MPTKDDCRAHRMQAQWTEVDHNADRLAVGAGLLARAAAAPETPSKGQVRRLSVFDSISGSYASRLCDSEDILVYYPHEPETDMHA